MRPSSVALLGACLAAGCSPSPAWIVSPPNEASYDPDEPIDLHVAFDLAGVNGYLFCAETPCSASAPYGTSRVLVEVAVHDTVVPLADLDASSLGDLRGDVTAFAVEGWNIVEVGWRMLDDLPGPLRQRSGTALASFFLDGPPEEPVTPPLASARIDAGGGTLATPDGAATLVVPPNALAQATGLTIDRLDVQLAGVIGPTVIITPEELALEAAASLSLRWNTDPGPSDPSAVRLARLDADGKWQAIDESTADVATGFVTGPTDRLGRFTAIDCGKDVARAPEVICAADRDTDDDGVTVGAGDCDDTNPDINPNAAETCNDIDDNCDGLVDEGLAADNHPDADEDGYGAGTPTCTPPGQTPIPIGDCDDTSPTVFPNADETCNDIDDDCDGAVDEGLFSDWWPDADADGFGAGDPVSACSQPAMTADNDGDCDDTNPDVYHGQAEQCGDGIDNDCDETTADECP